METLKPRGGLSAFEDMVRPPGREMDSCVVTKMSQHGEQSCLFLVPEKGWEHRAQGRTKRVCGEGLPRPLCLAAAAVKVDCRMVVGTETAEERCRGREASGACSVPKEVQYALINATIDSKVGKVVERRRSR